MIYTPVNDQQYDIYLCPSDTCQNNKQFVVLPVFGAANRVCPLCSAVLNGVQFKFPEVESLFNKKKNGMQVIENESTEKQIVDVFNLTEKFIKMLSKAIVLNHKVIWHIDETGINTVVIQKDDKV